MHAVRGIRRGEGIFTISALKKARENRKVTKSIWGKTKMQVVRNITGR
jgi:hypothetical protein